MNAKPMYLVPSPNHSPREACQACIKSPADEGWRLDSDDCDDSGLAAASVDLLITQQDQRFATVPVKLNKLFGVIAGLVSPDLIPGLSISFR